MNLTRNRSTRKLTTLMVTHSMRQALDFGHRTSCSTAAEIVLDVAGDSARRFSRDLIAMFRRIRGQTVGRRCAADRVTRF